MEKLPNYKSAYKNSSNKTIKLLFFLPIILICFYLGLWQIDRGNQKIKIYSEYKKNLEMKPIVVKEFGTNFPEFTNLRVFGKFLKNKQFLLDNRIVGRKPGYEVITPYEVGDRIVLVSRGWLDNNNRQIIPEINIKTSSNYINGYVYYYKKLLQLDAEIYTEKWPKIVQNIEIDKIESFLNFKLEPYILVMHDNQENSYKNIRVYKKNSELKHFMYAGQWFLFSIIAFIFMIILLKRDKWNAKTKT